MFNLPDITEERKKAAALMRECLYSGLLVREALKQWPKITDDPTLVCARHALIHYAADEDIHKKNYQFKEEQIDWLETLIKILSRGDEIPKNIIETYEEYYEIPITLRTKLYIHISNLKKGIQTVIDNFNKALGK
jgi:hypothetical protein